MPLSPNRRIFRLAASVFLLDQSSKLVVLNSLSYAQERIVIPGFFKLIHVGNTGAAWSMFSGNNTLLAFIALAALIALFLARNHFGARILSGQIALGLIFGGILGNLLDRVLPERNHVIDFLYFYLNRADGSERWSFPAFNVADTAICIGVGLVFILNWKHDPASSPKGDSASTRSPARE